MQTKHAIAIATTSTLATIVIAIAVFSQRLESVTYQSAAPAQDSLEIIIDDRAGKDGPDAIADMTVLSSSRTVKDSTIACAIYRTGDKRIGLMTPAFVVRRFSPDSVRPAYDTAVVARCTPLLEANGLRLTSKTVHPILEWSIQNPSRAAREAKRKPRTRA